MDQNIFSPSTNNENATGDVVASILNKLAAGCLILGIGLLPILFIPGILVSLPYVKIMVIICVLAAALLFMAFSFLRTGNITIQLPLVLLAFWSIPLVYLLSAFMSGDFFDSFIGNSLSIRTVVGSIVMALVATVMITVGSDKKRQSRLFFWLLGSALVLGLFHVLRLIFGVDFLSFGLFNSSTSSLLGSWNDIALFYGLVVILAMVTLEQLPLSGLGRIAFSIVVFFALVMLMVVNFFSIWLILGFMSLALLMYSMTKHRFVTTASLGFNDAKSTLFSSGLAGLVFIISVVFIIGGSSVSTAMTKLTNISYVEVRPSFGATTDIVRQSLNDNFLTGVGAARFSDAWRLYKDPSINETNFWNVSFNSGSSLMMTSIAETGLLGILAWLSFLISFMVIGIRTFARATPSSKMQQYTLLASFISALYIWLISWFYVPGTTLIILGAAMTGLFLGVRRSVLPVKVLNISLQNNRQLSFLMIGIVMLVIVGSLSSVYYTSQHFITIASFNKIIADVNAGGDIEKAEAAIANLYTHSRNDVFASEISGVQLSRLNYLLTLPEPTTEDQQAFQAAAADGVNSARIATQTDYTEPRNHLILAQIYSTLTLAGVEGAKEEADKEFMIARQFDPYNPEIPLMQAQLESYANNTDKAREYATQAVQMKRNYTNALAFLAQLDIAEGNVDQAIATTQAIVSIEPNNPARYYQLGVLLGAADSLDNSIKAFEKALTLDANFANARYMLALALSQNGDKDAALEQLQMISENNPDNQTLLDTIEAIKTDSLNTKPTESIKESNNPEVSDDGEQVVVTEKPDTDLVSPVNVAPDTEEQS